MTGHRQMHATIIITAAIFLVIPLSMATCYLASKGGHTKEHAACSRIQEKESFPVLLIKVNYLVFLNAHIFTFHMLLCHLRDRLCNNKNISE